MTAPLSPQLKRQIVLLACAAFASAASLRVTDPMVPELAAAFQVTPGTAAGTVSAFALAYGLFQLVFGLLGDRLGKFRVISWAVLACALGTVVVATAHSFHWVLAGRFLTGAFAGAIIPLSMAWIADGTPYESRQPLLAYFLTGQIFGVVGGQMIGGIVSDHAGWRATFWVMLMVYLGVGLALLAERRRSPDVDGLPETPASAARLFAGIADIARTPWAQVILGLAFVEGMALFGSLAFLPSYLHFRFDVSLSVAGSAMAAFGIGGLMYTTFSRQFLRRLREHGLALGGGCAVAAALAGVTAHDAWYATIPWIGLIGFGYYMFHNTLQINATQMAPAARGTAVAMFASLFFLGQSLGVWLIGVAGERWGLAAGFRTASIILLSLGVLFWALLARRARQLRTAG